jgi:Fungal specific transcription factor domain
MDLFDSGIYFSSHVPIKALTHPLLKYAACACAAKQLGRITGRGSSANEGQLLRTGVPSTFGSGGIDWYFCGARYYEQAIQILMKKLQGDDCISDSMNHSGARHEHQRDPNPDLQDGACDAKSDEVLAATAILSVYEFLDGTGPDWNRHLSGAKSLLDVAQRQMISSEDDSRAPVPSITFSQARRAVFWNFARQDYLSGREYACNAMRLLEIANLDSYQ